MKQHLTFTLIAWLLIFSIFEGATRFYQHIAHTNQTTSKYTFNPTSMFIPHPFFSYAANPAHPDHNAQGYRADKTRLYEANADAINIACLGGSSTYGTRVYRENSYPQLLEELLSKHTTKKVNVINGGLGGYSTPNIISLLSLKIIHLRPTVIIFYVGYNDAWTRLLYTGFKIDYSHAHKSWLMPEIPFWRYSRLLDLLASKLGYFSARDPHIHMVAWQRQDGDPDTNWRNSSSEAFRQNLITLIGIARAHGSIPVMVTQATDFAHDPMPKNNHEWIQAIEEHTRVVKRVADDMSVDLIDIRNLMTDREEYFADMLHMNEKGNKVRAEFIADYLIRKNLVRK